jgi:hypothetical protein
MDGLKDQKHNYPSFLNRRTGLRVQVEMENHSGSRKSTGLPVAWIGSTIFLLVSLAAVLAFIAKDTYAFFSDTAETLMTITTGIWATEPPVSGTSIDILKNAEGYWEKDGEVDRTGVRGFICVSNRGDWPARDLSIVDTVQIKKGSGPYADLVSLAVDLGEKEVLAPGETACYAYDIPFSPVAGAKYRNTARATITNHSGWMPGDKPGNKKCPGPELCPFGPDTRVDFSLPKSPTLIGAGSGVGKRAPLETPTPAPEETVDPAGGSEAGATGTPEEGAETATETGVPPALPSQTPEPTRTPTESPTLPPTPTLPPAASGCTYSPDHWGWNPQAWPVEELELGGEVYRQDEALEILLADPAGDEAQALLQQLIAAKLNLENGAVWTEVEAAVEAAGEWLEAHPPGSKLKKPHREEAADLAEGLEEFNLGLSGPGLCEDEGKRPTPTEAPEEAAVPTPTPTETAEPTPTPAPAETAEPTPTLAPSETPEPSPTGAGEADEEAQPGETPTLAPAGGEEADPGESPTEESP